MFNRINKIRESGLLEKWIQDWTPNNTHCKGLGPVTQTKVATVTDFQGALFLLGMGLGVGILLLLAEICYYHTSSALQKRPRNGKSPVNGKIPETNNGVIECNGLHTLRTVSDNCCGDRNVHSSYIETMFNIDV